MELNRWYETGVHMGIYGWRKRCLCLVTVFLVCTTTLNTALIWWMIQVLHLRTNGMSYVQLVRNGVQLTTKTYVWDELVASSLFTRRGEDISVQSDNNITIRTTGHDGREKSSVSIGDGRLEIITPLFNVTEPRGNMLFSVDKDTVSLSASTLSISGVGGSVLDGSLQTPILSAGIRSDLKLESQTKGVQTVTPSGVSIESRAGDIQASSYRDISLITVDGSIRLESNSVFLPTLQHSQTSRKWSRYHQPDRIYQLCVCANGELYLGEPDITCEAAAVTSEICR